MALDMDKLNAFIGRFVGDLGATIHAGMIVLGDKLGLYKALAQRSMTSAELAAATSTDERYVREWLASQAASGYITFHQDSQTFSLTEEQAFTLADPGQPRLPPRSLRVRPRSPRLPSPASPKPSAPAQAWAGASTTKASSTAARKFFKAGYIANLVSAWLPALDGVQEKLTSGIHVADVGCGKGASTLIMAQAFPHSHFTGFDYHDASIAGAQRRRRPPESPQRQL